MEMNKDRFGEIAKKAYELYEKSEWVHGRDFENWLEAEKIVIAKYAKKELAGVSGKVEKVAKAASLTVKKEVKGVVSGVKATLKGLKKTKAMQG
jgi:hypothetical protein